MTAVVDDETEERGGGAEVAPLSRQPPARPSPRGPKNRRRIIGRWVQRILLAGFAVGVVVLVVLGMLPKPIPVDMAEVGVGPMVVTVDEDGQARVRDRYVVSAPLSGRLARIELDPGDEVEEGKVLARIMPLESPLLDERTRSTSEARVAQAEAARAQTSAQIARADASLTFAKSEARRQKQLFEQGVGTQQQLDQSRMAERTAKAERDSARFAQRVAEGELKMARAALGRLGKKDGGQQLEVPAPMQGSVLKVMRESEGVVQPGTPLLELGDASALEIVVDVLTSDAVKIRPGAKVQIDRWGGSAVEGRVRRIEPSAFTRLSALGVEEQRVNVVIDLEAPREKWQSLGDGYRVEAHITVWEEQAAVTVPVSAVFRHDGGWAVYRVDEGVAHLQMVKVGQRNDRVVQVVEGVQPQQRVVVHPSDRIRDGVEVVGR